MPGALPQVMSGAPAAASGADMTLAMVLAVVLAVLVPEPLAVLPPLPVVGVSVGLPVSLGVGVGLAVALSLGVGVGLGVALPVGVGVGLAVGLGVQAMAGSTVVALFFLDVGDGLVYTPSGGCHGPRLPTTSGAVEACRWPGEVTESVGVNSPCCTRFSVTMPTATTATTAATANAGFSQAAAGPRRSAVLLAGVRPLRCAPVDGCRMARWLSSQKKDSSRTDSRIRYSRSQSAARPSVERADRRECDR